MAKHMYSFLQLTPKPLSLPSSSPSSLGSLRVLSVLSALLERAVDSNEKVVGGKASAFDGLRAPDISIHEYVCRIFTYANCSPACFVVAYLYLDRFVRRRNPQFLITSLNVHRLLVTSVMIAAKFFDDAYYNNSHYAKVGGIGIAEMNRLEMEFLFSVDFRLHVTVGTFESYCHRLENEMAVGHKIERLLIQHQLCGFEEGPTRESSQKQTKTIQCTYSAII